jgi:tripartite-type tricarboxylate transporter receptor subunit TctC
MVSGQVAMALPAAAVVASHVASGKIRMLATAGTQRAAAFPDKPTLVESGYPDVVVTGWTGLVAPMGTPPDILNKVSRDVARVLTSADVRAVLAIPGSDLTSSTPEAFTAFIKSEIVKWTKVIRAVGLENTQ